VEPTGPVDADQEVHVDLARRHVADGVTVDDLADISEAARSRLSEVERIL
jgi:hypothetical protein